MTKTVVLCGGKGLRLRPLTDEIPKPLVNISGKPILQHLVAVFSSLLHLIRILLGCSATSDKAF